MEYLITFGAIVMSGLLGYGLYLLIMKETKHKKNLMLHEKKGLVLKERLTKIGNNLIKSGSNEQQVALMIIKKQDQFDWSNPLIESIIIKRIKTEAPPMSYLSKLDEEHFALLATGQFQLDDILCHQKAILEAFNVPIIIEDQSEMDIKISISLSLYPQHGSHFTYLLESAWLTSLNQDQAGQLDVYQRDAIIDFDEAKRHDEQLKTAIIKNEFQLFYQPIEHIESRTVVAFESRLRWYHKQMGILTPDKFFNHLESSGQIHVVGQKGLKLLLEHIKKFKLQQNNAIYFTYNVSLKQLLYPNMVGELKKVIKGHEAEIKWVYLELSRDILSQIESVKEPLIELNELGFKFILDQIKLSDTVKAMFDVVPIHMIKLQPSVLIEGKENQFNDYVNQLKTYQETPCIVTCLDIVNEKQFQQLKQMKIAYAQGNFFAQPMPLDDAILMA